MLKSMGRKSDDMGATVDGSGSAAYWGMSQGSKGTARTTKSGSSRSAQRTSSKNKKQIKRKLNYNYRELSGQILRARKVQTARAALIQARSKVTALQACATNDQYDKSEVSKALAHAKRMVNCARLKVDHMKEEESQETIKKRKAKNNNSDMQKDRQRQRLKQDAEEKERALERAKAQMREQERAYRELMRRKKRHRNEENEKVMEANVKYLTSKDGTAVQDSYIGNAAHVQLQLSIEAEYAAKELREAESDAGNENGGSAEAVDAGVYAPIESNVSLPDAAAAMTGGGMDIMI